VVKRIFSVLLVVGFLATMMIGASMASAADSYPDDGKKKFPICHKPGTPAEKTLYVPYEALGGHLGHGDYKGECKKKPW
jgi:hypothetical protein